MKKPFLGDVAVNLIPDGAVSMFANEAVDPVTGRQLISLPGGNKSFAALTKICQTKLGLKVASTADFKENAFTENDIADADVLIFKELGIALLGPEDSGKSDMYKTLDTTSNIQNEKIVFASTIPSSATSTWGIQHTNAISSNFTGKKIKVAILDTGFDLLHPDFAGRVITSETFVPDVPVQDGHGHGTHCIGTACGNVDSAGVRYGVAGRSHIFAGKVLGNDGRGAQGWILGGMEWAGLNKCKVVSMSLGSPTSAPGFDDAYEKAAKYIMSRGGIVVAAAGNESRRSLGIIAPVGSPANCPSILAVAALDANDVAGSIVFNVANFSCGTIFPGSNAKVNIAAPGVGTYSSWPMPTRYNTISGTSMATPHVAGLLALLWEQFPRLSPSQIIVQLFLDARSLPLLNTDVGVGLALAN